MDDQLIYVSSDGSLQDFPLNSPTKFSVNFDIPLRVKTSSSSKWFICLNNIGISTQLKSENKNNTKIPEDYIVKIKCLNIRNQIHNNSSDNTLAYVTLKCVNDSPFQFSSDNTYAYQFSLANKNAFHFSEIENPTFLPLLTNELTQLSFEITDLENNLLTPKLVNISPTILQLRLRKMNQKNKSFKLTISKDITEDLQNFTYTLNKPLFFKENNWKVCLKSISLPLRKKYFTIYYTFNTDMGIGKKKLFKIEIPNKPYTTEEIFETLQKEFDRNQIIIDNYIRTNQSNQEMVIPKSVPQPYIHLSLKNDNILVFNSTQLDTTFIVDIELARVLGLCHECYNKPFKFNVKTGRSVSFLNMRLDLLFSSLVRIDCNILNCEYYNDEAFPILKIFSSNKEKQEIVTFRHLEYKSISQRQISEINFQFNFANKIPYVLSKGLLFMELHFTNDSNNTI